MTNNRIPVQNLPKLGPVDEQILDGKIGVLNRTKADAKLLIYNRVPKVGSTMLLNEISKKQKTMSNQFEIIRNNQFWDSVNSVANEKSIIQAWKKYQDDFAIWEKHMYFIDVESYDPNFHVNWINQVRDPVERFISNYYYLRGEKRWVKHQIYLSNKHF